MSGDDRKISVSEEFWDGVSVSKDWFGMLDCRLLPRVGWVHHELIVLLVVRFHLIGGHPRNACNHVFFFFFFFIHVFF
jgi:hypothetical protein